jgi:hypothetical protein
MAATKKKSKKTLYADVINAVFSKHFKSGATRLPFTRDALLHAMSAMGLEITGEEKAIAKNIGDIIYSFRFRRDFPDEILKTAPKGKMWMIVGKGDAQYEFRLITTPNLSPDPGWYCTKLHDATPEIVRRFKLGDEQAVLARIRYNRLVDLFCKCVAYSLQNHLRTKVEGVGQIEIDELYVGVNRQGEHFIIPVQVKKERDRLGVSQLLQDLEYCQRTHPKMSARALGAQLFTIKEGDRTLEKIVIFEFECKDTGDDVLIRKLSERHFLLLPHSEITTADLETAATRHDTDEERSSKSS